MKRYLLIISFLLFLPISSHAATLYLEPESADYYQGESFILTARVLTKGECINTIEAHLKFPTDFLEIKDISQGNSIISLWLQEPRFSNKDGTADFLGGIPGGYCGQIPGDPGESNLLAKIIFGVKTEALVYPPVSLGIEFSKVSQVLLNDGLGTPAEIISRGARIMVLSGQPAMPRQEWLQELEKDKIPPEPFEIKINQEPSTFEGKYFLTFNTSDKQTGVDHYQVKEGKGEWLKAASPYLLKNQNLKNKILVRAFDKAGNERITEIIPSEKSKPFYQWIIIAILAMIIIIWLRKKLKARKKNENEIISDI